MGSYRLRLRRKSLLWRARRKAAELAPVANRTGAIRPGDVLLFATIRNEAARLPFFLDYYRKLGVDHFLIVDNDSDDGSGGLLQGQADVSLWRTGASYRASRYGVDWLNHLRRRHGHGHWVLGVDADELLVYPHCETRPIRALTDWLDSRGQRAFGAILLDMYPKGPVEDATCAPGQNPIEAAPWFDSGNYRMQRDPELGNMWIQGGLRSRAFFADDPYAAPALNKIPLVRWDRSQAYVSSTHTLLPRGLNRAGLGAGGPSGALLHGKFLSGVGARVRDEAARGEHYRAGAEYRAYAAALGQSLWSPWSEQYLNWRQLEWLGLMSQGGWA
ncbi:MAG: glycosyltransferase family 2 protein [Marinibacterium sp.]|nr:glycosyltransferase family 2 protein [Marinibacterium sp.]